MECPKRGRMDEQRVEKESISLLNLRQAPPNPAVDVQLEQSRVVNTKVSNLILATWLISSARCVIMVVGYRKRSVGVCCGTCSMLFVFQTTTKGMKIPQNHLK